ncbi:MAG: hypothetical protein B7X90_02075 [Novosphingobium sp. 17-62-19]|nr:MAG: hypothetical protein B7Y74_02290 [Novosphingobium sp. 35-62-5]OZA21422.1 MAG: hypothetical protein B7X90_02075 [Novosphingobium sp. 17-62-19]
MPRPQEQGRRACGTERVISTAPLLGALRGFPAEVGVEEMRRSSDQGGDFLPSDYVEKVTPACE